MLVLLLTEQPSELEGKLRGLGHEVMVFRTLLPDRNQNLSPDVVIVEGDEARILPLLKSFSKDNTPVVGALRDDGMPREIPEGTGLFCTSAGPVEIESLLRLAKTGAVREKQLREQIRNLEERLETRKIIDRAKGILIDRFGLSDREAYRRIQKRAMDSRKTMREIAEGLLVYEQFERTGNDN